MRELDAAGFATFFLALWGKPPFAWQRALAEWVCDRSSSGGEDSTCIAGVSPALLSWPQAIALPTAAGKTACMDIAVYALAAQAGRLEAGLPFTAPLASFSWWIGG